MPSGNHACHTTQDSERGLEERRGERNLLFGTKKRVKERLDRVDTCLVRKEVKQKQDRADTCLVQKGVKERLDRVDREKREGEGEVCEMDEERFSARQTYRKAELYIDAFKQSCLCVCGRETERQRISRCPYSAPGNRLGVYPLLKPSS